MSFFVKSFKGVFEQQEQQHLSSFTVFLTTHDVNDIDELCKRTIIIDKGNIVYDNSLDSLKTDFSEKNDEQVELRDVLRKIYKSFGD